jgi:hypothetical protein
MSVPAFGPAQPGTALVRAQPRAGLLLRLVPQPGVGEPAVQWSRRTGPAFYEVLHGLTTGADRGRAVDGSLRTHVSGRDPHTVALEHVADRAADVGGLPEGADPGWGAARIELDGRIVRAEQGIVAGYEVVLVTVHGRAATIVTSVFDAERFEARYATFRPWFERDDQTRER